MNESEKSATSPPASRLFDLLSGYWVSQAIYALTRLGAADVLSETPQSCDELAGKLQCDADALYRLLRALAGYGITQEDDQRRFVSTALSEKLRTGANGSMRAMAIMLGEEHFRAWGHLLDGVKTGKTPFETIHGQQVFDYFDTHSQAADIFHRAMVEHATLMHRAAVEAYDFTPARQIVDVGGGRGTLLATILNMYPKLQGVLFDQPDVVGTAADDYLKKQGVLERCRVVGGDFFQQVPPGGDHYVLSTVIHDWDDPSAITILRNVQKAIRSDGRLLLIERVLKGPNEPDSGKMADLNMLVMTGGRERSEQEYGQLLQQTGFKILRVIKTRSPSSIVEATIA